MASLQGELTIYLASGKKKHPRFFWVDASYVPGDARISCSVVRSCTRCGRDSSNTERKSLVRSAAVGYAGTPK